MSDLWDQDEARSTPVPSDTCIFCKLPEKDWDDDLERKELDTGEILCSRCHGDLREYTRYRKFLIVVSDAYAPAARTIIHDHLEQIARELADVFEDDPNLPFLDTVRSDASTSTKPDTPERNGGH